MGVILHGCGGVWLMVGLGGEGGVETRPYQWFGALRLGLCVSNRWGSPPSQSSPIEGEEVRGGRFEGRCYEIGLFPAGRG